jgi:glycosyltransferase involved in cell wall biosynthesis
MSILVTGVSSTVMAAMDSKTRPIQLFIVRPTLGQGGADRVTLTLLKSLNRQHFDLTLVLSKRVGEFLEDVPADVQVLSLNAPNLWFSWFPLWRLLRQHRPDILFSTSGGANIPAVIAFKLARLRGRLVLSERNTLFHSGLTAKRRLVVWFKRTLYNQADRITAVSQGVQNDVVETLGIQADHVQVIYNPIVDDTLHQAAQEPVTHPWFQQDIPIVLAAGRLVVQKDFQTLLRAFAQVRNGRPARLVILGEGPLEPELKALSRELGIEPDVWFGGFDKNPFKYMAKCAVFVLSSLHEGLPGVLIQAMACGAPVIATDCPFGPAEIITEPGKDGILVPVGDVKALVEKLEFLLSHPEIRQQMGEAARHSVERFSVETILSHYVAALCGNNIKLNEGHLA